MPTFIEALPKQTNDMGQEVFIMSPGSEGDGTFYDGTVSVSWFTNVFNEIATATLPLAQKHYDKLKSLDRFWKINAINWRKNGVVEIYNIPADELIQEEEDFLLEMYPPKTEEQSTEEA